ncbi:ceramide-1-phosphate transfer protein isoform X1 [Vombatus ursinus]|nr:ceramide-1-phosphate transfer protein isoform X1 [Vombatus ursinus]XP_027711172.1 ceramide-1-phosphate transfer protein isoform X1 [Vombatus ursinus]XP_027711173.1 ceramide-1-phosphate transfer protein isoform X1 [Vombatus ursinus]
MADEQAEFNLKLVLVSFKQCLNEKEEVLMDPYITGWKGLVRFSAMGLLWALAMKMAIEEINNSSALLPGIHLGYDLYDTCTLPMVTMKPSLLFMSQIGSRDIGAYCNYTRYWPRVVAVIGPHSSELALMTGKLFGFFLMPQVSYGASSDRLSNRELFPSFFRTIPSDRVQLQAIVDLLSLFNWNWVAAVGSDDEYGRQGLSIFSTLANNRSICIAHEGTLPLPRVQESRDLGKVESILRQINQSIVQVVVLFSSEAAARNLFQYCIQTNVSPKVWVASEAWLASEQVIRLPGIQGVGTILGFLLQSSPLPEFSDYVNQCLTQAANQTFCNTLGEAPPQSDDDVVGPQCPQCDDISHKDIASGLDHYQPFSVYAAVYSVAHALHLSLGCNASGCPSQNRTRPWELVSKMYDLRFSARSLTLQFDNSGNVNMTYDLKLWVWHSNTKLELLTVGSFREGLELNRSQIRWHGQGNEEPVSRCSRECEEGQVRRVKGFHSCCYDCLDCKAGTYRQNRDNSSCTVCEYHQWSPDLSTQCFPRTIKFLAWREPVVIALLLLLVLAVGLSLVALGLFCYHWGSPVVQASGGNLSCFGLGCLTLVCLSVLQFPGRPSRVSCLAQQPLFHLPLTGCLSTLFLKSAEIFLASEFPGQAGRLRNWLHGPRAWLLVALLLLMEGALCTWYLLAFPQFMMTDWQALPREALMHCRVRSWFSFGMVHTVNVALAFLCFLGTFMVQSQAGRYNLARGITFAMLVYFITWISFIPLFANVHKLYQPAMQMAAILLCAVGILATFYLPKCYLLLWESHLNSQEFFQSFLELGPWDRGEDQEGKAVKKESQ